MVIKSVFTELLEYFTKRFVEKMGRSPQTSSELMSIQNDVVRYLNKTKGDSKKLTPQSMINERYRAANPYIGFKPTVIQGGKSKEGIEKAYDKFYDKTGRMRDRGADIMQKGLAGLEKKTLFKDSPEAIAKMKADNKAAIERLKAKKKTVEDFSDDGDFDPGGMASGGLARVGMVGGGPVWKKFIEGLFMKASNDIRLGKGKWAGLNQDQWIKQHDDLTKMLKKWEMSGRKGLPEGASEFLGMNDLQVSKAIKDATSEVEINKVLNQAYDEVAGGSGFSDDYKMAADQLSDSIAEQLGKNFDDLSQTQQTQIQNIALKRTTQDLKKRLSQPTKTLEGIKKEGTIDISDPEVADEFTKFMKESDPKGYKDLEQKIQLEDFDVTDRKKNASGGIAGQLHLNQGGRAKFQDGLSAYQEGMQLMGPSNLRNYPGGDREEVWDPYSGSWTSYGYDTEGAAAARSQIAGKLGAKGEEYLTQYDPDFDIDAMRDPFAPTGTNVPGTPIVPTGGVDVQGGRIVPSIQNPGSGKYDFIDASGVPTAISDEQVEMMLDAPATQASTPVAGDKKTIDADVAAMKDYGVGQAMDWIPGLEQHVRNLPEIRKTAKSSPEYFQRSTEDMIQQFSDAYGKAPIVGPLNQALIETTAPVLSAVTSIPYDIYSATQRMEPGSGAKGLWEAIKAENIPTAAANRFIGAAKPLAKRIENVGTTLGEGIYNLQNKIANLRSRGIDERMARSYKENIQAMADPRMTQNQAVLPTSGYDPKAGEKQAAIANILPDLNLARGGRASLSKGGLAKILGV